MLDSKFTGKRLVLTLKVHDMKGIEMLIPSASNPPCCNMAGTWLDPHLTYSVTVACGNCHLRPKRLDLCSANSSGVEFTCKGCDYGIDNEGEVHVLRRGEQAVTPEEAVKAVMEVELVGKFMLSSRDTSSRFRNDLVGVVNNQNPKLVRGEEGYKFENLPEAEFSISTYGFYWAEAEWDSKYENLGLPAQGDKYDTNIPYWPLPREEQGEEEEGVAANGNDLKDEAIGNRMEEEMKKNSDKKF